jgi:hypothetical protein
MKVNNKYTIYNERHYCLDFSGTLVDHEEDEDEDVFYIDEEIVNRWKAIQDAFFVMQDELEKLFVLNSIILSTKEFKEILSEIIK